MEIRDWETQWVILQDSYIATIDNVSGEECHKIILFDAELKISVLEAFGRHRVSISNSLNEIVMKVLHNYKHSYTLH